MRVNFKYFDNEAKEKIVAILFLCNKFYIFNNEKQKEED